MPIEAIGPSARLVARSDSSRQSSPAMTVPPEAMIGSNGAAPRRHRGIPAASSCGDRLPESRDVQQRVVRRRADHEDEEDALHLAVEHDDAGVRQPPDGQQRHAQREHRGQQHEDRQQRRAIDDDEDDEHRDQRHREQQSVDPEESLDEIGGEAGRTGHPAFAGRPGSSSATSVRISSTIDARPRPRCRSARRSGPPRRPRMRSGGETPSCTPSTAAMSSARVCRSGELGLAQRAVARDDDHGGDAVAAEEVGKPFVHLRGVGALGEERRAVVGRDLVDLAEEGPADGSADQPDQDEQAGDADPQPSGGLASARDEDSAYR